MRFAPLVLFSLVMVGVVSLSSPTLAQSSSGDLWQPLTSGVTHPAVTPTVWAMDVAPNGDLYVGGQFADAGGNASAAAIARWDGTAWHDLGADFGPNDVVTDMDVAPNGDLWIGGAFFNAGGVQSADYVARWDGAAWHGINTIAGRDVDASVTAIRVADNGDVYVGGYFAQAGGVPGTGRIARWDGAAWSPLGGGIDDGGVRTIALADDGTVYAGGDFNFIGGDLSPARLAQWDGSAWSPLGDGFSSGSPEAMALAPNGDLYIGGTFANVGNTPDTNNMARWDGSAWHAVGTGLGMPGSEVVFTLLFAPDGRLLAGGSFENGAGNADNDAVATWDGTAWTPLGGGLDERVFALAISDDLYAGGQFTGTSGGTGGLNAVGRYTGFSVAAEGEPTQATIRLTASPNPAFGSTTVRLAVPVSGFVRAAVYDARGREVAVLHEGTMGAGEAQLSLPRLAPGLYIVRALSPSGSASAAVTVVR